jgi:hypothetical protein
MRAALEHDEDKQIFGRRSRAVLRGDRPEWILRPRFRPGLHFHTLRSGLKKLGITRSPHEILWEPRHFVAWPLGSLAAHASPQGEPSSQVTHLLGGYDKYFRGSPAWHPPCEAERPGALVGGRRQEAFPQSMVQCL